MSSRPTTGDPWSALRRHRPNGRRQQQQGYYPQVLSHNHSRTTTLPITSRRQSPNQGQVDLRGNDETPPSHVIVQHIPPQKPAASTPPMMDLPVEQPTTNSSSTSSSTSNSDDSTSSSSPNGSTSSSTSNFDDSTPSSSPNGNTVNVPSHQNQQSHPVEDEEERNGQNHRRVACLVKTAPFFMLFFSFALVLVIVSSILGLVDKDVTVAIVNENPSTNGTSTAAATRGPPTTPVDDISSVPTTTAAAFTCPNHPIEIPVGSSCQLDSISPEDLQLLLNVQETVVSSITKSHSRNDNDRQQRPRVTPPGPYAIGTHIVSVIFDNNKPNNDASSSSCSVTLVVTDAQTEWKQVGSHAYRVAGACQPLTWPEANAAAQATSVVCTAASGHLATITNQPERDVVRGLASRLDLGRDEFWLGGFQPTVIMAPKEDEPTGGWMWVNDEGLVFDGYTDWDPGEPNNSGGEDCMIMLGSNRGFRWDDRPCGARFRYIEEVELDTVIINGCDSGVPDTLIRSSFVCTPSITRTIALSCGTFESTNSEEFSTCVDDILTTLVDENSLTKDEKERIVNCGDPNRPPQAVCQDVDIKVGATEPTKVLVNASSFDNGSNGDPPLGLELQPAGPFPIGSHTVTLKVTDGRGGSDSCQATLTISDENRPPVARCRNVINVVGGPLCSGVRNIRASQIDNGSFDPEGSLLTFRVRPSGPYGIGTHTLTLKVSDDRGYSDSCQTTLVVADNDEPKATRWMTFENHAYRVQTCAVDWETARESSASVSLCGNRAHLATITSAAERDTVRDMARNLGLGNDAFWLGGFQPEMAPEPAGDWTWVNDEGQVYDGYTDWDPGEPNNKGTEDCMIMLGQNRGYRWDDRSCGSSFRYFEEVDLGATVVIDGCDTGVPDILTDVESCDYLIAGGLSSCRLDGKTDTFLSACVDGYLAGLVESEIITPSQRDAIADCAASRTNNRQRYLRR